MSMSRKDYVCIAAAVKETRYVHGSMSEADGAVVDATCAVLASRIADCMQRDNARFDRSKFLTACGVSE